MAAVDNWRSVLSLFLPRFSPLSFFHNYPSREAAKKLTLNQIAALVPGTDSSTQQFRDLDIAGKINKIHIYFLGSLSSLCAVLFLFLVPQKVGGAAKALVAGVRLLWKTISGSCFAPVMWSIREGFSPSLGILPCRVNLQELIFYF